MAGWAESAGKVRQNVLSQPTHWTYNVYFSLVFQANPPADPYMKGFNKTETMLLLHSKILLGFQILCSNTQHYFCRHVWCDVVVILHKENEISRFGSLSLENIFLKKPNSCIPDNALGSHWNHLRASPFPLGPPVLSKPQGTARVSSHFFCRWPPAIAIRDHSTYKIRICPRCVNIITQ